MSDETSTPENQASFLPFHAINEFMRHDFRSNVIRHVLTNLEKLDGKLRHPIDQATKKYVKVPGFRNADKAPALIKVIPMAKAFEKTPDLVVSMLAAWAELHTDLRQQLYDLLQSRGWQMFPPDFSLENLSLDNVRQWAVLPVEADRTRLPGFYTTWPKDQDFEAIYQAFTEKYPEADQSIDNVSLMTVWLSMRLPVNVEGAAEQEEAPKDVD